MDRRKFLALSTGGAASTAIAAPAIAQSMPAVKWRMTSGFTKSLAITYGAGETFAQ